MLRFLSRDLLWFTLVLALILGWWLDHLRHQEQRANARREFARLTRQLTKCDQEVHGLQRAIIRLDVVQDQLSHTFARNGDPLSHQELKRVVTEAIREADEREEKGLLPYIQ